MKTAHDSVWCLSDLYYHPFLFIYLFPLSVWRALHTCPEPHSLLGPELSLRLMTGIGLGHLRVHYDAKCSSNCECVYCTVCVICVRARVCLLGHNYSYFGNRLAIKQMRYLAVTVV